MPEHADGYLIPFTTDQRNAMEIENIGVRFGEHPTHSREVDQNTATRTFLIKGDQLENFVELVCGRSKTWDDAGTTKLSRLIPDARYGRFFDLGSKLIATKVTEAKGHPKGGGKDTTSNLPGYEKLAVNVFYEQPTCLILSDGVVTNERQRYLSPCSTTTSELETIGPFAGGSLLYTTADASPPHGTPMPWGPSMLRTVERFDITWHGCPFDLYSDAGALWKRLKLGEDPANPGVPDGIPFEGTVNSVDLVLSGIERTYPAGTLLLEKVEPILRRRQLLLEGTDGIMYDFKFHWAYTSRGWLAMPFWNAKNPAQSGFFNVAANGTYYTPATMPDKMGIYNCRDHSRLFDPNY